MCSPTLLIIKGTVDRGRWRDWLDVVAFVRILLVGAAAYCCWFDAVRCLERGRVVWWLSVVGL